MSQFILIHRTNNSLAYGPFNQSEIDQMNESTDYRIILLNDGKNLLIHNKKSKGTPKKCCVICGDSFRNGYMFCDVNTKYCSRSCFEMRY